MHGTVIEFGMLELKQPDDFRYAYELDRPVRDKIRDIVTKIYGGSDAAFTAEAEKQGREKSDQLLSNIYYYVDLYTNTMLL